VPLKRVGLDILGDWVPESDRSGWLRDSASWSFLVVEGKLDLERLQGAFKVPASCVPLQGGLPRNDIFVRRDWREAGEDAVRALLGEVARPIVLFAPTTRGRGIDGTLDTLDWDLLRDQLGERCQVLVRRHPGLPKWERGLELSGFVTDVSEWMDVQQLLVATSILVTDYSSLLQDFSRLQRPIIHYIWDYDAYSCDTGMYEPLEKWAKGPVVRDTEGLVRLVKEMLEGVDDRPRFPLSTDSEPVGPSILARIGLAPKPVRVGVA
jgi:CDP-glycerol glycerophosphotransferase (TagB/SpsB family)